MTVSRVRIFAACHSMTDTVVVCVNLQIRTRLTEGQPGDNNPGQSC